MYLYLEYPKAKEHEEFFPGLVEAVVLAHLDHSVQEEDLYVQDGINTVSRQDGVGGRNGTGRDSRRFSRRLDAMYVLGWGETSMVLSVAVTVAV